MSNTTITFEGAGGSTVINPILTQWDKEDIESKAESTALSGRYSVSVYHQLRSWQVTVAADANSVSESEWTDFRTSTAAAEQFTMTDLDDSDNPVTVQRVGAMQRTRASSADVGFFSYSFTVREAVL